MNGSTNILFYAIEVMEKHPLLRIGQLIVCAAKMGGWKDDDVFYCPDDVLFDGLKKMLGEKRQGYDSVD